MYSVCSHTSPLRRLVIRYLPGANLSGGYGETCSFDVAHDCNFRTRFQRGCGSQFRSHFIESERVRLRTVCRICSECLQRTVTPRPPRIYPANWFSRATLLAVRLSRKSAENQSIAAYEYPKLLEALNWPVSGFPVRASRLRVQDPCSPAFFVVSSNLRHVRSGVGFRRA